MQLLWHFNFNLILLDGFLSSIDVFSFVQITRYSRRFLFKSSIYLELSLDRLRSTTTRLLHEIFVVLKILQYSAPLKVPHVTVKV